jgi:hypothetical protein
MGEAGTADELRLTVALMFDSDAGSCRPDTTNGEPPWGTSHATCGVTETFPLTFNLLETCEMPATFFTPDYTVDHHPHVVHSLAKATKGRHSASPEGYAKPSTERRNTEWQTFRCIASTETSSSGG